uniref:Putative transmembrane protein n=1 Tax=Collimonas sp. MPS11E8 TaxID=716659 RepID=E8ZA93_9BURK|nr:putative transmembrane protein [Collimonas sp. MPS11E8]
MQNIRRLLPTVMSLLVTLLYPLAIWLGHGRVEPRLLALLLVLAAATRLPALKLSRASRWWLAGALLLAAVAIWNNALLPLKLYPVLVNLGMLTVFGYSLYAPPSIIERMARLSDPALPAYAVAYTRRVTQVWCGFFVVNGVLALLTAIWASAAIWSLYNGVLAYMLMGCLFAGEYLVRIVVRRRHRQLAAQADGQPDGQHV